MFNPPRGSAVAVVLWSVICCQVGACSTTPDRGRRDGPALRGRASYYSAALEGRPTASGEIYDPKKLTAAHRTLPFGSRVRVTNLRNGRSVVVRINDRGPFGRRRRIIDLSLAAARSIGMVEAGVVEVQLKVLPGRRRPLVAEVAGSRGNSRARL